MAVIKKLVGEGCSGAFEACLKSGSENHLSFRIYQPLFYAIFFNALFVALFCYINLTLVAGNVVFDLRLLFRAYDKGWVYCHISFPLCPQK